MQKVVLITGASSGIGKATAEYLSAKDFNVYGTTRKIKDPNQFSFKIIELDVCDSQSIKTQINFIIEKEGRLDILINNAGLGIAGPLEETDIVEVEKIFQTNVFGLLRICQEVLPQMRKQKSGKIINISSLAGFMGLPYRGIYSASKYSVEAITEALSMEVKQFGIDVLSIAPGDFNTNISANRYHAPSLVNSPYQLDYEKILTLINDEVSNGLDPSIIAKQILKIANSKTPRLNYKAARPMQKLAVLVKKIVSGRIFERILMNHYKL